jgi:hypothetical protein
MIRIIDHKARIGELAVFVAIEAVKYGFTPLAACQGDFENCATAWIIVVAVPRSALIGDSVEIAALISD